MENPENTSAWKALRKHSEWFKREDFHLSSLVSNDKNRFQNNSIIHEGLLFDYSKNYLQQDTLPLLIDLAQQQQIPAAIEAMFRGEKINNTEQRAALHVALRDPAASDQYPEVGAALAKMETLIAAVHSGKWQGYTGKAITDVVNIGIGGSDLGPAMVCDALSTFATTEINIHFVSNIDPAHLQNTLKKLRPETTLFIVASKSFSTLETLNNAKSAQQWLLQEAKSSAATGKHFVAITTNSAAALQFGIEERNIFPLWDWVGGRFSLWSTIGLPIALLLGIDGFRQLLAGAHSMDEHFRTSKLSENIPVISALLGFWYREFFNAHSSATIPYSQRLNLLPSFLQQLYMESLGKSANNQGGTFGYKTGEVVWGNAGTNGQHSYFQLFHQGTEFVPVEFIAVANATGGENTESQQHLLANCFSQSLALMNGKTNNKFTYKHVQGNKPSNTILLEELNAYNLGKLLALYEHKVYVLSVIWNINAFDQWGVELGKELSQQLFVAMSDPASTSDLDDSTQGLIQQSKNWKKK
jgi:glucose-6-phosphate isomerase